MIYNHQNIIVLAISIILFSASFVVAETGENTTSRNLTIVTGTFGFVVNYCNNTAHCGSYSCFLDYDGISVGSDKGYCRQSSNSFCVHNGTWNSSGTDASDCKNSTHKWTCSSGTWTGSECTNGCSAGACVGTPTPTPTATPTSSSGGGSSSGITSTPTPTSTPVILSALAITSKIADFNLTQGESTSKSFTIKNDGKRNSTNVSLSITGIETNWYKLPPKFDLNTEESKALTINFSVPADSKVKDYIVTYKAISVQSNASASFVLKILPSEETIEKSIIPLKGVYKEKLSELEKNITELEKSGSDTGELKGIVSSIKIKLNQISSDIENKNYFEASQKLSEVENLLADLENKIKETSPHPFEIPIGAIVTIIAAVAIAVITYMFWPVTEPVYKHKKGWMLKDDTIQEKIKKKIEELKLKIQKKFRGKKFRYSYAS